MTSQNYSHHLSSFGDSGQRRVYRERTGPVRRLYLLVIAALSLLILLTATEAALTHTTDPQTGRQSFTVALDLVEFVKHPGGPWDLQDRDVPFINDGRTHDHGE